MRILFSSTRGAGHLQPLLPYARALIAQNHEVVVAAPAEVGDVLRDAGLAHAPFDHPGDEVLAPIWTRLKAVSDDEGVAIVMREIFAGVNARIALPKLQDTIRSFRPDIVIRDSSEFAALVASARAGVRHARVGVCSVSFEEAIPPLVEAPIDALRALAGMPPDEGASLRAEAVFSSFPASLDGVPAGSRMRAPFRVRAVEEPSSSTRFRLGAHRRSAPARLHHIWIDRRKHSARPLGVPHGTRRGRGPPRARAPHDRAGDGGRCVGIDPGKRPRRDLDSPARRDATSP